MAIPRVFESACHSKYKSFRNLFPRWQFLAFSSRRATQSTNPSETYFQDANSSRFRIGVPLKVQILQKPISKMPIPRVFESACHSKYKSFRNLFPRCQFLAFSNR